MEVLEQKTLLEIEIEKYKEEAILKEEEKKKEKDLALIIVKKEFERVFKSVLPIMEDANITYEVKYGNTCYILITDGNNRKGEIKIFRTDDEKSSLIFEFIVTKNSEIDLIPTYINDVVMGYIKVKVKETIEKYKKEFLAFLYYELS